MGRISEMGTNLYVVECTWRRIRLGRVCRRQIVWGRIVTDSEVELRIMFRNKTQSTQQQNCALAS